MIITIKPWRDNYGTLCSQVSELLEDYGGYYVVQSEDDKVLTWYRKYTEQAVRGRILTERKPSGRSVLDNIHCIINNMMLTNLFTAPDFIAVDYAKRSNISLKLCSLLYHVPIVCMGICSEEDYEAARTADDIVIFEEIEP